MRYRKACIVALATAAAALLGYKYWLYHIVSPGGSTQVETDGQSANAGQVLALRHNRLTMPASFGVKPVANAKVDPALSAKLQDSAVPPMRAASEVGGAESTGTNDTPVAPRLSPEWLSAVTQICDSPLVAVVHIDEACKVLRKDAESIVAGVVDEGDSWPEEMEQTLADFAKSLAARNRIKSVSVTCDSNGYLLFLEGSLGRMFQKSVNPDAQWYFEFLADMAQQPWASEFGWPCEAGGCPYSGGVARSLPVNRQDGDEGDLLVFLRRKS